jgi:hypothetical protein
MIKNEHNSTFETPTSPDEVRVAVINVSITDIERVLGL